MRIPATTLLFLAGVVVPVEAAGVKLKAIRFPIGIVDESGPKSPPAEAPLSQRVVFEFTGKPKIGPGIVEGLRVRVAAGNPAGQPAEEPAFGDYEVSGNRVIFTPRLPTAPLPSQFGPTTDIASDGASPGLRPDTTYRVSVTVGSPNSVLNLTGVSAGAGGPVTFHTASGVPGPSLVQSLFQNASSKPPSLKSKKTLPKSGTSSLHPNLFEDPAGLFTSLGAKKRPPFRLRFKGPLDPSAGNVSPSRFRLRAVGGPGGAVVDAVIRVTPVLTSNSTEWSEILLYPEGVLPLGHDLSLEVSSKLQALSGAQADPTPEAESFTPVASYRVAEDPHPGSPIADRIVEDFGTADRQDTSIASGAEGEFLQLASWDAGGSGNLRASFGFGGDGSLGRFEPAFEKTVITLDTDYQVLPLFSGATPDAIAGTVVKGGVFHFSDFHLPAVVTLRARGSNPLVITVTGDALIEGVIDLAGQAGTDDHTFDSAITSTPGGTAGAGGGRGGDSHPVYVPPGASSLKFIQTPQFAESGFGPGGITAAGGGGGQCGATMPWTSFTTVVCTQFGGAGDGSRGAGGGGGSFGVFFPDDPEDTAAPISGRRGAVGAGNHLPVQFDPSKPIPGTAGTATESLAYSAGEGPTTENAVARKNPNPTFAEAYFAGMVWDKPAKMDIGDSDWAKTTRVTFGGAAGVAVFADADLENDFIGGGGELASIQGGQGGGGGGSRTEGLSQVCKQVIFDQSGLPFTVLDAKGGGGGGGGGALLMQVLGTLRFQGKNAAILATGGGGGGGEQTGGSIRGGAGGGGSGGAVLLQSAVAVELNGASLSKHVIDVSGGCGRDASTLSGAYVSGGEAATLQFADGGPGGPGVVQIHTPDVSLVEKSRIHASVNPSVYNIQCTTAGLGDINPLVPMAKTPTPLTSRSVARSTWYDLGAVTGDFRPPIVTGAGVLSGPLFGVPGVGPFFRGTDAATGEVLTDATGAVLDPFGNDIDVDAPDLLLNDVIPKGPTHFQSVAVRFQGADEDPSNPGSPDLTTATSFVADITLLNGRRFLRWQIDFDVATEPSVVPGPTTPRPQVNFLRVPFRY